MKRRQPVELSWLMTAIEALVSQSEDKEGYPYSYYSHETIKQSDCCFNALDTFFKNVKAGKTGLS